MKTFFFTIDGRLNRARFWLGHLGLIAAFLGVFLLSAILAVVPQAIDGGNNFAANLICYGLAFVLMIVDAGLCFWAGLCLGIKRYHDRDKPGAWVLIQFAPIIGAIWYFVEAFCLEGTRGPNTYGADLLNPSLGDTIAPAARVEPRAAPSGRPGWVLPLLLAPAMLGVVMLLTGFGIAAHTKSWLDAADRVEGTVIALKPGTKDSDGHIPAQAIVEAKAIDGTSFQITDGWSTYPPKEIGSKVSLAYPAGQSDQAIVAGFMNLWFVATLVAGLGTATLLFWLFVALVVKLAWKRQPRGA